MEFAGDISTWIAVQARRPPHDTRRIPSNSNKGNIIITLLKLKNCGLEVTIKHTSYRLSYLNRHCDLNNHYNVISSQTRLDGHRIASLMAILKAGLMFLTVIFEQSFYRTMIHTYFSMGFEQNRREV